MGNSNGAFNNNRLFRLEKKPIYPIRFVFQLYNTLVLRYMLILPIHNIV